MNKAATILKFIFISTVLKSNLHNFLLVITALEDRITNEGNVNCFRLLNIL